MVKKIDPNALMVINQTLEVMGKNIGNQPLLMEVIHIKPARPNQFENISYSLWSVVLNE